MDDIFFFPFYFALVKENENNDSDLPGIYKHDNVHDDEWDQEYQLIYNSYVLDSRGLL